MRIIGITGLIGAGKTQTAQCLEVRHYFTRVRFAGPLKEMMLCLGLTHEEVDGSGKELPCELLGGCTPRRAMQTLGTEWGRQLVHSDLWINAWKRHARRLLSEDGKVVADDVRFQNEVDTIRSLGGKIIQVSRPGVEATGHVSEGQDIKADVQISNNGSLADLQKTVDGIMRSLA
jgi:hypothetical protein